MKILFLINYAGKAGIERYVENFVDIYSKAGHECHFAYNLPGELSDKMQKLGIPVMQVSMEKSKLLSAAKQLAEYCKNHGIDIIHPQCPRENIAAIMSLKHYAVPRVVFTNHFTNEVGTLWRLLNRRYTPKNHKIIAVCRQAKDIMIRNGVCAERIEVIYNGVFPRDKLARDRSVLAELGIDDERFVMSILARFEPEKGLPFLLESVQKLQSLTDKPFTCIICGDGSEFNMIKTKIRELSLEDKILCTGYRTDPERILAASDLYLNSSSCNEAMSFAILESMSAGLPCVVTDIGGNRDLAETGSHSGIVCDYGDSGAFAEGMLKLMEDDNLRLGYGDAAYSKLNAHFNLLTLAEDTLRSYE